MIALANAARGAGGLAGVWVHPGLVRFARAHAERLADELNLYHQDLTPVLNETDLNWAAENDQIGVGVAQGRNGTWFYVQLFGRRETPA